MIIVSACLAGVCCRYDGTSKINKDIMKLVAERKAIPLCPEVLGGRKVPREQVEIINGTGEDVIDGKAFVKDKNGNDVTEEILNGVKEVLLTIERLNVKVVILKTKSPTCGFGKIYDGTFSSVLKDGNGVLAAALIRKNIKILTEENFFEFIDAF